jgi:hypothetical protein
MEYFGTGIKIFSYSWHHKSFVISLVNFFEVEEKVEDKVALQT